MTRRRLITATLLWAGTSTLFGTLASPAAKAADMGYPPPPGPYRSEPSVSPDLKQSSTPETAGGSAAGNAGLPAGSSRMLPLPEDSFVGRPGSYDASNLFGAGPPAGQTARGVVAPSRQHQADNPASIHFKPPAHAEEQSPGPKDFSMDFSRGSQRPPLTPGYQWPDGRAHQAYPAYAPAYPDHHQYADPYHPGQMTDYAPMPAEQGYPDYHAGRYAPAYPQAGSGMPPQDRYPDAAPFVPGYATDGYYAPAYPQEYAPAPAAMPLPDTVDNAVFRPAE